MTANSLPGNPFLRGADHDNGGDNFELAQAVLAVAFELRTANMISAYNGDLNKRVDGAAAEMYPLHNTTIDRLGLA